MHTTANLRLKRPVQRKDCKVLTGPARLSLPRLTPMKYKLRKAGALGLFTPKLRPG